jgi:dihydroorotate dehydrogenase
VYFISAPFGNYIKRSDAVSVTGTWTLQPRPGRFQQIIKTLRYTRQGWRNKLGLRNPGIWAGLKKTSMREVLSLAAIQPNDWLSMYQIVNRIQNLEINVSCPNLDTYEDTTQFEGFELFANQKSKWCIVKIPPTATKDLVDKIVDVGYTQIHASNTLPTDKGGLSGQVLVPYTLELIDYIKKTHPHVSVIAGGGVYAKPDAQRYINAGADHISLGTVCFTPWKLKRIIND